MIVSSASPYPPYDEAVKNFLRVYTHRLRCRGLKVVFVYISREAPALCRLDSRKGITYLVLRTGHLGRKFHQGLLLLLSYLWLVREVHFWGRPIGYSHWLACLRKTFITLYHQRPIEDARLGRSISPKTTLVVESEHLRDLVERMWQREARVIYPGIDLSLFKKRTRRLSAPYKAIFASSPLPKHHGSKEERYLKSRGVLQTIEISHLLGQLMDFETTLLWRKDPTYVLNLVDRRRSVRVIGQYIEDMNDFLEEYDLCFALFEDSAYVKAIPTSVMECLAKGIPVICRQGSALSSLLTRHGAGLEVPADEFSKSANLIAKLLRDKARYYEMSDAARWMAQQCFDIDRTVDRYIALYRL